MPTAQYTALSSNVYRDTDGTQYLVMTLGSHDEARIYARHLNEAAAEAEQARRAASPLAYLYRGFEAAR